MTIISTISTEVTDPVAAIAQAIAAFGSVPSGIKQFAIPATVAGNIVAVLSCTDEIATANSWLVAAANETEDTALKAAVEAQV